MSLKVAPLSVLPCHCAASVAAPSAADVKATVEPLQADWSCGCKVIAGADTGVNATPRKMVLAGAAASVVAGELLPASVIVTSRLLLVSVVVVNKTALAPEKSTARPRGPVPAFVSV